MCYSVLDSHWFKQWFASPRTSSSAGCHGTATSLHTAVWPLPRAPVVTGRNGSIGMLYHLVHPPCATWDPTTRRNHLLLFTFFSGMTEELGGWTVQRVASKSIRWRFSHCVWNWRTILNVSFKWLLLAVRFCRFLYISEACFSIS